MIFKELRQVPMNVGPAAFRTKSHVNPDNHVNPVKHADRAKAGKGHFYRITGLAWIT
jgi:hypothetical protein